MTHHNPASLQQTLTRWLSPLTNETPNIFAVGGAVRDHLLGRPTRDVDIVCRDARKMARCVAAAFPDGASLVNLEKKPNAPCYRVVNKSNASDFIDIVELHGSTIENDLPRRDFTVNAIAAGIRPGGKLGGLIDPLNGQMDLRQKQIRCCRPDAFAADPLRMIRAIRLSATLGFSISADTSILMAHHAKKITTTAFERITLELLTLLTCSDSYPFIQTMEHAGLLEPLFPEITSMKGCTQNAYHHLDVWDHALATLANCESILNAPGYYFPDTAVDIIEILGQNHRAPILKLAALFHDVGKPAAARFDEKKQRTVFHGHADIGDTMATAIARRMKLPVHQGRFLACLVQQHMWPHELSKPKVRKSTAIKWFRRLGDDSMAVLILAAADSMAKKGTQTTNAEQLRLMEWIASAASTYIHTLKRQFARPGLINGRDLIGMGMAPGPAMGDVLGQIRTLQDEGIIKDRETALDMVSALLRGG